MLKRIFPSRQQPISIPVNNKNNFVNSDLTGSLKTIVAPIYISGSSKARIQSSEPTVFNIKPFRDSFRTNIFQYGGKYIQKYITSFNSGSNQLIVANSSLDYGTETVSPDNFEVLYNGIHIPGLYTVEQSGSNVVITLQKNYIDYSKLISGSTEINIYGKFK